MTKLVLNIEFHFRRVFLSSPFAMSEMERSRHFMALDTELKYLKLISYYNKEAFERCSERIKNLKNVLSGKIPSKQWIAQ